MRLNATLPPQLDRIINKALEKKLGNRYQSARELKVSLSLGIKNATVEAISPAREVLIIRDPRQVRYWASVGTLARLPLTGGTPRDVMQDAQSADIAADGSLAASRYVQQRYRLEYPAGKMIYENPNGYISHVRISPKGDSVAFLDHPLLGDDRGWPAIVDRSGHYTALTREYVTIQGLAWSPDGNEVWYTAGEGGFNRSLYAVTRSGQTRPLAHSPSTLEVADVRSEGLVLVRSGSERRTMIALAPGARREAELEAQEWPHPSYLTPDGKYLLYYEGGEGGGPNYSVYLAATDGSSSVRLGDGIAQAVSRDQQWALTTLPQSPSAMYLLPVGPGEPRKITNDNIDHVAGVFFPDGKHIIFTGAEPGHRIRTYVQDLQGGAAKPISAEGVAGTLLSPDGKAVVVRDLAGKLLLLDIASGQTRPVSGLEPGDAVIQWSADGRSVYATHHDVPVKLYSAVPAKVYKVDLATGGKQLWRTFLPADTAGVAMILPIFLTPDGRAYAYGFHVTLVISTSSMV